MGVRDSSSISPWAFTAAFLFTALLSAPLLAVTYTWDPLPKATSGDGLISGGYGTWTTSTTNRNWTTDGGVTNGPWVNGSGSAAIFQGTGGIVTASFALTTNSLTFESDGYNIQNSNAITLAGTTPFISIPTSGHQATIRNLAASSGFTVTGEGTLTAGLSSITAGTITVQQNATLKLTNNVELGFTAIPNSVSFAGSGTIQIANVNEAYDSTPTGTNLPTSSPSFSGKLRILNSYTPVTTPAAIGTASIETLGYSQVEFNSTTGSIYPSNITLNSIATTGNSSENTGTLHLTGTNPILTGNITLAKDSRVTSYATSGNIRGTILETGGSHVLEIGGGNGAGGTNTLILSGTTAHTGGTIITGTNATGFGNTTTLFLDYSTNNSSKFLDNSSLTSQGSNILTLSGATGNHTEVIGQFNNFGALTINRSGANTAKIALGAMKNGGVLNVAAANLATTTTPNNSLGYLPGVVFSDTQLAANDGAGNIVAAPVTYTTLARLGTGSKLIPSAPNSLVRLIEGTGASGGNFFLNTAVTDIGSLLQTATGSVNLTVDLQLNTLRLAANGEIISQADRTLTLTPGILTAGGANNTPGTVTIHSNNSSVVINSSIRDNGTAPVAVVTGGNVSLGASSNTFSGGLTVVGGTTTVTSLNALGTNNLITLDGGKLSLNVTSPTLTKDIVLTANGGHIGSGNSVLAGTISGSGALTLSGNTLTTVTGQNSYTGGTKIVGLQVAVGANTAALGTGPISIRSGSSAGGNFWATGGVWANDFRISGEYQVRGAIRLADATLQGNIAMEGNSGIYVDVNDLPGTVNGVISGPYNFRKSGKGQLTLSGTNTYTGSTTIDGTLAIVGSGSLGNGDYHNDFLIVDSFATATLSYESTTNQIIRGRVWTSGNLIKSGSSTLTVMGDINADITVNGGKLLINGAGSGIDNTIVTAGILGGAGSLPGTVTVQNGGTLSPGSSIESFHVANVVLNAGSSYDYELTTSNLVLSDLLVANGNVTLDGALLNLADLAGIPAHLPLGSKVTLINYSGTLTGTFAGLPEGTALLLGDNSWQISYADTSGGSNLSGEQVYPKFVTLTTVAIPEPSTMVISITLFGLTFLGRRRFWKAGQTSGPPPAIS